MLSGLRGLAQTAVRAIARAEVALRTGFRWLQEAGLDYPVAGYRQDYEKFAQQEYLTGAIAGQDPDHLIPGEHHEESLWQLSQKFRYEVLTPWETEEGEVIEKYTTIISPGRLTPNEVYDQAADHPSEYAPEEGLFHGAMEIVGSWYR